MFYIKSGRKLRPEEQKIPLRHRSVEAATQLHNTDAKGTVYTAIRKWVMELGLLTCLR